MMTGHTQATASNDANFTLFAHVSSNPDSLVEKAFNVQQLVEQGASISEAAHDAPLVLGARAFAKAHLDSLVKLPSPSRSTRKSFSLNPKSKIRDRNADPSPVPFAEEQCRIADPTDGDCEVKVDVGVAVVEDDNVSTKPECYFIGDRMADHSSGNCQESSKDRRHQRPKSRRRIHSLGPRLSSSAGPRYLGRNYRSKSRCRVEGKSRFRSEQAASIKEQLTVLQTRARKLEEAQKRLAHLEEQAAMGLSRISQLAGDDCTPQFGNEESASHTASATANLPSSTPNQIETVDLTQASQIRQRMQELEDAHQELKGSKDEVAAEILFLRAETSSIASRTCELAQAHEKIEGLEYVLAEQASQISNLSSQLVSAEHQRQQNIAAPHQTESARKLNPEATSHEQIVCGTVQTVQGSQIEAAAAHRCTEHSSDAQKIIQELAETRERVQGLESTIADQAAHIMNLARELPDSDAASGTSERARHPAGASPQEGEVLDHDFDFSGLRRVCAALYSERAAQELAALPHSADTSSLALLADLVRRFPLAAGSGHSNREDASALVAELTWPREMSFEAVD